MTLKTTLALGAAGLSFLTLAGTASAQTTVGDPNLTTVFSTVAKPGIVNYTTSSQAIGFDPSNSSGKLSNSPNQATAQSVYEAFVFDSSFAGTFSTLASGTMVQLSLFAADDNINVNAAGVAPPFDVYASLYAYSPSATSVPVSGPNLFGSEQKIVIGQILGGYFSGDFNLTGSIVAGQSYVLGLTTLNSDTQDFAQIGSLSNANSGLATADNAFDDLKYATDVDDQGNPIGQPLGLPIGGNNTNAFTLSAKPAAAVPEASSVVSMGLLLSLSAGFAAFKRRRSLAN